MWQKGRYCGADFQRGIVSGYGLFLCRLTGIVPDLGRALNGSDLRRLLNGKAEIVGSLTQFREAVMPIRNDAFVRDVAFDDSAGRDGAAGDARS